MLEFHVCDARDVSEVDYLLGEVPGCFKAGSAVNYASSGRCWHEASTHVFA
jgi:hypothetical protein